MDFTDLLKPKSEMVALGRYYPKRPKIEKELWVFYEKPTLPTEKITITRPFKEKTESGYESYVEIIVDTDKISYKNSTGAVTTTFKSGSWLDDRARVIYFDDIRDVPEWVSENSTHQPILSETQSYELFNYNPIEERFKQYNTVENIQIDGRRLRIETKDNLGFKIKAFVRTQDGEWWTITDVQESTEKKGSLRFRKIATDTKYILSLINVEL